MTTVARTCSVEWCERALLAQGYCSGHYKRVKDKVDLEKPFRIFVEKTGRCSIATCNRPDDHRNMCKMHYTRMRKYSLTPERAQELFVKTTCEICGRSDAPLVIDHDHSCCPEKSTSCGNCIRGVICARCNSGLGYFFENVVAMKAAIAYLSEEC